jgi:hypothetical protein
VLGWRLAPCRIACPCFEASRNKWQHQPRPGTHVWCCAHARNCASYPAPAPRLPARPPRAGAEGARNAAAAALQAAGALAAEGGPNSYAADAPWEPFFARPTVGAPSLFRAVASEAAALRDSLEQHASGGGGDGGGGGGGSGGAAFLGAEDASRRLQGLGLLLGRAAGGAEEKRAQLALAFREASARQRAAGGAGGGWLFSGAARDAWGALAQACLLLKPRLPGLGARLELDGAVHLPAAGHLLAAASEALPAGAGGAAGAAGGGGAQVEEAAAAVREEGQRHASSLLEDAGEELQELRWG